MPDIPLRRESSGTFFESASTPHPGLFLSRGIREWKADKTKKGEDFQTHVCKAIGLAASEIYKAAYFRWYHMVVANPTITVWPGKLDGRMFIGMGGASVVECAITLSRTYGVPIIPGSAQKGLAQAYGKAAGLDTTSQEIIFGREGQRPDSFDSGYVFFHDAWWVPGSAPTPLSQEIVTVHHPDYYQDGGIADATDFDSPVPNIQVAARGGFLFTVECAGPEWAVLARDLLAQALQKWGIGGKTASGYGRFVSDETTNSRFLADRRTHALNNLTSQERLRAEVNSWSEKQLADKLGKERNKTLEIYENDRDALLTMVAERWGDVIQSWRNEKDKFRKRVYKTVFQRQQD